MFKNEVLILGINFLAHNTKCPQNIYISFFIELFTIFLFDHMLQQILDNLAVNKVFNEKVIIFQNFHQSFTMHTLTFFYKIFKYEKYPFGNMDFKDTIIFYQVYDDFVNGLMHFVKFFSFIHFLLEYFFFHVFTNIEKQFKKKLT